jgi:hypothetical protein
VDNSWPRNLPTCSTRPVEGNSRFSPVEVDGTPVAIMYAARSQTVALLETCFHDVHQSGTRIIAEATQLAA